MKYTKHFQILFIVLMLFLLITCIITIHIQRNTIDMLVDELLVEDAIYSQPQALNERTLCATSSFKSWMPYQAITATNSKQYELQQQAFTETTYGLRMIGKYFLIAVTSQFGNVGDLVEVHTTETSFYAIIGDIKDAGHDDCQSLTDTSVIEFIVDNDTLHNSIRISGNLNSIFIGEVEMINNLGSYK